MEFLVFIAIKIQYKSYISFKPVERCLAPALSLSPCLPVSLSLSISFTLLAWKTFEATELANENSVACFNFHNPRVQHRLRTERHRNWTDPKRTENNGTELATTLNKLAALIVILHKLNKLEKSHVEESEFDSWWGKRGMGCLTLRSRIKWGQGMEQWNCSAWFFRASGFFIICLINKI